MSYGMSERASERTNERSAWAKRAVRSKRMCERCKRTEERMAQFDFICVLPNVCWVNNFTSQWILILESDFSRRAFNKSEHECRMIRITWYRALTGCWVRWPLWWHESFHSFDFQIWLRVFFTLIQLELYFNRFLTIKCGKYANSNFWTCKIPCG